MSGNLGLGVIARQVAALILSKGFPLAVLDIDPGAGRGGYDTSFRDYLVPSPEALPFSANLFVLPPPSICDLADNPSLRSLLLKPDRIQCALVMWEQTRVPRQWLSTLRMLDVIVAPSHFVYATFTANLDGVWVIPAILPVKLPDVVPSRERFGLPADSVIFVTSFEPQSDPERKNPLATVKAFQRSFPNESKALLVVKVNNPAVAGVPHPIVLRLRDEAARDPRLRVTEHILTYQEVLSLYAACDVFVSLHRSEGLGLGPIEAMALGKPVIATAWSGNMTFMSSLNSCLVNYRLVPVKSAHPLYSRRLLGPGARWADPDLADAEEWMARLYREPSLRSAVGARAAASIASLQKESEQGLFLAELVAISERLPQMPSFHSRKTCLPAWEHRLRRADRRRAARDSLEYLLRRHIVSRLNRWMGRR